MSRAKPNRGIAKCPNRATIHIESVRRGRADTPGFDRWPNIQGRRVTEFGVSPLPRKTRNKKPASAFLRASCFSWVARQTKYMTRWCKPSRAPPRSFVRRHHLDLFQHHDQQRGNRAEEERPKPPEKPATAGPPLPRMESMGHGDQGEAKHGHPAFPSRRGRAFCRFRGVGEEQWVVAWKADRGRDGAQVGR